MNHTMKFIGSIGKVLTLIIFILLSTVWIFLISLSIACTGAIDYISERLGVGGEPLTSKIFNVDED